MKNIAELKEEAAILEKEIVDLEDELARPVTLEVEEKITGSLENCTDDISSLLSFASVQKLMKQREILERLTDIDITSVHKSHLSSENVRQIKGAIGNFSFCLKFTTEGEENSIDGSDTIVKNLSIKVEGYIPEHIKTFINRCESSCCVKDFFQGFASYCHRCEERTKTFEYFTKKYSNIASWDEENQLLHARTKNEIYTISWENLISDALISHPVLDLFITTSVQGDAALHKSVSSNFQEMIEKHGIEAAIDTLLTTL